MLTATCPPKGNPDRLRSVRPSLLDLRFTGDPWLAVAPEGAALCLDDYCLVRVAVSPLDIPSFYHAVLRMRHCRSRGHLGPARAGC